MILHKPDHPWNDPDGDGHDCVDCPEFSIWRCSQDAHPGQRTEFTRP